jgi:hypothetical protein
MCDLRLRGSLLFSISLLAALAVSALPAAAQSVISTRSGVVHYVEGSVYLDGQLIQPRLGRYTHIPQGSELRTTDGHAEVLLTPGVFLRMGEQSSIRLVANDLTDTQVELTAGSLMIESGEPNPDTSVTLTYKDWKVHLLQKGTYRMDSNPPRLLVREGKAEAFAKATPRQPVVVQAGMGLPFANILVPEPGDVVSDSLSDWAGGRSQSIYADNTITAQIDQDPANLPPGTAFAGAGNFTYFPMLGLSAPAVGLSGTYPFTAVYPPQPGFNSIYLPGYTYQPTLIGLGYGYGQRAYGLSPLRRAGVAPGVAPGAARGPGMISPLPPHLAPAPHAPVLSPVPAPVRAGAPHVGVVHGGGHR